MTIIDTVQYITGDKFTRECPAPYRAQHDTIQRALIEASASGSFPQTIKLFNDAKSFMLTERDISLIIPKREQADVFYALKMGEYSFNVPSYCLYVLRSLYEEFGSVSLAIKALSKGQFKVFFQKNYLTDATMLDVIKSYIDPDYEPFTLSKLRIHHKDYDEIYIADKDMVALLPKDLSEALTDNDLPQIEVTKDGLAIKGLLLRFLGGHYGAINSIYDLRGLI